MAPGSQDYYLHAVAHGVEDYYLGHGEVPGQWVGTGREHLGLSGEVAGEQLTAVLAGAHPDSGERLAAHPARKVPGFDLTFRAPKSVSLLWGLADETTSTHVQEAHEAAVAEAVDYLERHAARARRGAGGAEQVDVDGLVGAAFRHRTSRAGDPLLHTHVLIANPARTTDDGVWRTVDSRALFAHAKTAGTLYQAALRHELTRTLGVGWNSVVNGAADLAGVDRAWIDAFSKRRTAIVSELDRRGESSAAAAQVATLQTRQAKPVQPSEGELRTAWWREAEQLGIPDDWDDRVLGQAELSRPDLARLYDELVEQEQLTAHASSFTRRDVMQAIAGQLPTGATAIAIERLADAILDHDRDRVIPLGATRGRLTGLDTIRRDDRRLVPVAADQVRYTTRGLLLVEQRAVNLADRRRTDGVARVAPDTVDEVLQSRSLSEEQVDLVRRLTASGHGVDVVVGKAGTGKTYALDTARQAWEAAGMRVTGVALAARAALELSDTGGIPSTTLARFLGQCEDDHVGSPLAPGSVLVVDEAGMVGSRHLARLLDHADAQQAKVVLVGDTHQLPEVDAGGLFRALTTRLPSVELSQPPTAAAMGGRCPRPPSRRGPRRGGRRLHPPRPHRHRRRHRGHP